MQGEIKVEINQDAPPSGSDLTVVNAARVSFDKRSELVPFLDRGDGAWETKYELSDRDKDLIHYLARGMSRADYEDLITEMSNTTELAKSEQLAWKFRKTPTHKAPFGHCFMSFRVKCPIFVARQLVKHKFLRMSEVSRRYVDSEPEFWEKEFWRVKAPDVKQGSSDKTVYWGVADLLEDNVVEYNTMIHNGICPEQARAVLPLATMTEFIWSGSLDAFADMCNLRLDNHAQEETREVAKQISALAKQYYPVSWEALVE